MARERLYRLEAIVLKRSDIGEADRLLTLLTPARGKLRVIAKGARKPSSRKSGHVELFTRIALLLAQGKQLDIITQADTLDTRQTLRANLDRIGYAYYLAELVDQFAAEENENLALFELLDHALTWLGDAATNPILLARFFELHLLTHVGYRPQLFVCENCGKPVEPIENYFSITTGGVLDPNCVATQREHIEGRARDAQTLSLNALKALRYLQTRSWDTVRAVRLSAATHAEIETLLYRYIAHHLERNLKSVEFLRELRQPSVMAERESR
ncbi:MAG: DNA repair protein RecO [Chloroflexi bacterium]|nr:DNA repair protein RecO [Chloroflexota bacterium]